MKKKLSGGRNVRKLNISDERIKLVVSDVNVKRKDY